MMQFEMQDRDLEEYMRIEKHNELQQYKVSMDRGDILYEEQCISKEMSILQSSYTMKNDLLLSGRGEHALLELQFNISNNSISYKNGRNQQCLAAARSANMQYLPKEENAAKIFLQKDICYKTFDVHLPINFLNNYAGTSHVMDTFLGSIEKSRGSFLIPQNITITQYMYGIIEKICHSHFEGLTKRIYLESQIYELIAVLYDCSSQKVVSDLNATDIEKIQEAAAIIRENLDAPLTILALAKAVGTNQTKLKTGFRKILKTTIFGYLQDIRMTQAKTYLLDTNKSIQEISILLGYQNIANFSNAFKKVNGFSPISMRQSYYDKAKIYS